MPNWPAPAPVKTRVPLLIAGCVGKLVKPPVPLGMAVPVPISGANATVRLFAQSPIGRSSPRGRRTIVESRPPRR